MEGSGSSHHPFSLHTPIWAWLSPSARYKVALTCSQTWGGAGQPGTHRQAGFGEGARCPHQDRLGPGPQVLPQGKTKPSDGPRVTVPWPPIPAMKVEQENQHQILYFNYFISQMRN